MRIDAAEFVPKGVPSKSTKNAAIASNSTLSAHSPEFIPGLPLASTGVEDGPATWGGTYTGCQVSANSSANCHGYIDQDQFFTPQILQAEDNKGMLLAASEKDDQVENEDVSSTAADSCSRGGSGSSGASVTGSASGSTTRSDVSSSEVVGSVSVTKRRLCWEVIPSLEGENEEAEQQVLRLFEAPKGESFRSPRFFVAGVTLQLLLLPTGSSLTDDGFCTITLLSEEKTKLKFELFLNGRGSGTKVMIGQRFSCDFRRPRGPLSNVEIGVEVYANLLYAGFF